MLILNRILLTKKLGIIRKPIAGDLNSKIISTLEAAGYDFVRECDFTDNHYFLEFKKDIFTDYENKVFK